MKKLLKQIYEGFCNIPSDTKAILITFSFITIVLPLIEVSFQKDTKKYQLKECQELVKGVEIRCSGPFSCHKELNGKPYND